MMDNPIEGLKNKKIHFNLIKYMLIITWLHGYLMHHHLVLILNMFIWLRQELTESNLRLSVCLSQSWFV